MNRFQQKIINDAIEDPEPLTDWEYDFVNDLAENWGDQDLSPAQNKIINRISQKYLD